MKKVLFFILCLFCFNVKAQEFIVSNRIIHFEKIEDYNLQGFTVTDKYIIGILINENNSKAIIKVFDINSYQELQSIKTNSLGHANDVTYNSNTNLIYVIENGSKVINTFDADTLEYRGNVVTDLPIRSLTYIPDRDLYAARVVSTGFILNNDFSLRNTLPFVAGMNISFDTCRQGWSYYNGYIYYAKWSWIRKGGDGTNTISIYDLEGTKVDELITRNDLGELEDVEFIGNKMLLGINNYNDYVDFYLEDVPLIDEEFEDEVEEIIDEVQDLSEKEENKVDHLLIRKIIAALILVGYFCLLVYSLKSKIKKRLK